MSSAHSEIQLGEYGLKCVELIRGFVPGQEAEVEPAVKQLARLRATDGKGDVEERFKEEYKVYKAAADTIAATKKAQAELAELDKEGK